MTGRTGRLRPWPFAVALIGIVALPPSAVAGPTWDGGGGTNASWSTATNWNDNTLPDLAGGTSDIVFQTLGSGTAAAATQLGGGLIDILSLRSNVATGTTVGVSGTSYTVTGFSINSGTLVVQSGTISKTSSAALVVNSTLKLVNDGWFSSTNVQNTGLIIAGPIVEDSTSRNVVINASAGSVALGGTSTYTGSTTVERGTLLVGLTTATTGNVNAGISAAPGVAGALGNSSSTVVVGNATTAANNWDVGLTIGGNVSMGRNIRFANAGSGAATLIVNGGISSGTVTLDRTISWNANVTTGTWTGLVTGAGGISKGGGSVLRLTNTANDFSGPVSVVGNGLYFNVSGGQNALGIGTSVIQATESGALSARVIRAFGSGTFTRGFNVVATAADAVTIETGDAGDVTFSGDVALNSLGANVTLGAANSGTARYTGVISGSAPTVIYSGASSNGSKIVVSNAASSFTGQVRVGVAGLFIGGNVPASGNGPLGSGTSAIVVGAQTSGVNPSYLMTDGSYTVARDILIPGPGDGSADAFTGEVMIGNASTDASVYSGNLAITRTKGIGSNFLLAVTGGSVEFSGAVSGAASIKIGAGGSSGSRTGLPALSSRMGTVILSGSNGGFSGDIAVATAARLVVASNNALGTGTSTIAVFDNSTVSSGTGGISTRGAVTVSRNFQLDGVTNSNGNQNVSFEGTSADASVFTGDITIIRNAAKVNAFAAVAGGSVDFQGVITGTSTNGTLINITKNGDGLVIFSAANNYQGSTTINAGVLRGTDGVGISGSNVLMAGGVWESAGDIIRTSGTGVGQVRLSNANSGTSGFSSANAAGMTVAVGGTTSPTTLTWGATNFSMNTLTLNATTATGPLTFLNAVSLGSGNRTVFVGANKATVSGTLSGSAGALFKEGAGTLVLSASNSYTGGTTITAGRLEIAPTGRINASSGITIDGANAELRYNASTPLTQAITFTQGTISGTGTIGTAVTAGAGDVLSPGNSPGNQPYSAGLTLAASGTYVWEINDATGSKGVNWDLITVSGGNLNLSSLSPAGRFNLALVTLSGTSPGAMANYTAGDPGRWRIFDATSLVLPSSFAAFLVSSGTYTADTDVTSLFTFGTNGWQNGTLDPANASVLVAENGTGLDLVIVPEPAAVALAALGIGGVAVLARRRRRA